jgi:glutamate-5-semialdehyde dehydrogenase
MNNRLKTADAAKGGNMNNMEQIGKNAKKASITMNVLMHKEKNRALRACAKAIMDAEPEIMAANECDISNARQNNMKSSLIDRLLLTRSRLQGMADELLQICALPDPIGEVLSMQVRPNGLTIGQKVVPLGVVGIIYESRPNVTADAFGLCFKAGNAVILKGGSDAINSNKEIVKALRSALKESGCSQDALQLIEDTSRETVRDFMRLNRYIDVLIPRGGAGLIKAVVENSTIPVIETGTGNCHIYVDEYADFNMALNIIDNAKTQRLGVCNACESLVIHEKVSREFIPMLVSRLSSKEIEIRADERGCAISSQCIVATEEDYKTEYLDKIISLKVVDSIDDAIAHINYYNTKHSEAIVTKDYTNAAKFLNQIDAAAVYVNASTRFTDGNEFGFGAEIGISTQKLHARGPMGLKALTTTKYIILGNGQIRE